MAQGLEPQIEKGSFTVTLYFDLKAKNNLSNLHQISPNPSLKKRRIKNPPFY
jgi:hypothetical protein